MWAKRIGPYRMPALALALCLMPAPAAMAQEGGGIVAPPACTNDKGETVRFVDAPPRDGGRAFAAGMAARDADGDPVVYRSNYADAPRELQMFIDRHECGHHQTGDVDRPHPPRNGPDHLMNESISDCIAILRLRDEEGYGADGLEAVASALGDDMRTIGFPDISISSRIDNIRHCYAEYGPPGDFIDGVVERRGSPGR